MTTQLFEHLKLNTVLLVSSVNVERTPSGSLVLVITTQSDSTIAEFIFDTETELMLRELLRIEKAEAKNLPEALSSEDKTIRNAAKKRVSSLKETAT